MTNKRPLRTLLSTLALTATVAGMASATAAAAPSTVAAPATATAAAPSGEEMPIGNLPCWRQTFTDDFTTDVPLGSFPAAVSTKWSSYPPSSKDSSGFGTYTPAKAVTISNGILNNFIHTENGVPIVAASSPKLPVMTAGRYTLRYRFDAIKDYKMAFLMWPDSNNSKVEGEIDFPEMNLDATSVWAFNHRTNRTSPTDQDWFKAPLVAGGWHTVVTEWSPNLVVYILDGVEIGRVTERVPTTPMHWVLQIETEMDLTVPPDPTAQGNVQFDWASVYAYDTTTCDTAAPAVALTSPVNGSTVKGSIPLTATATDNVGVLGVQFKVDGIKAGNEVLAAPYTTPWNTALIANGTHTVTATARDNAGGTTTKTTTVTVDNSVDNINPTLGLLVPAVNGTIFPINVGLNSTFSEAVTGVDTSTYTLTNTATGANIPATVIYILNTNQSIARLTPINDLTIDTKYTVTMTNGIKDRAGNPLTTTSWDFITGPAPTATPTTPTAAATNVNRTANITITASENLSRVYPSNVTITPAGGTPTPSTISFDTTTNNVTIDPTTTLAANTTYTVRLTNGVKDIIGNPLKALTYTFTTSA